MSPPGQVRALALSCHPLPAVAVTAISAGLAELADLTFERGALVTAAVFTGQLSIGWSNDYLDADRDRAVQRSDKPIAAGAVSRGIARTAVLTVVLLTIGCSAALGLRAGSVAVATVLCGWLYNLGLKGTGLSWLPYALAFAGLPAIATLCASPPRWPATWAIAAGALLGVAAHFANVLPDLQDDAATGVRGLPHRLGARTAAIVVALVLLAASAVILLGPDGSPGGWRWAAFIAALTLTGFATGTAYRTPSSRLFFLTIIAIAAIDVASFALSGTRL